MIPVNEPLLDGREKELLMECIDTGWISSEGPFVGEFEEKFSSAVNRAQGIAVSSGSAALDVAVAAVGIGEGDEVIMPAFTIISPALSVVRATGVPVLVDSEADTWNMDVSKIEEKITERTKAIIAVHIYGLPVDMDPLIDIAKRHNLKVIEDAAEMHGQVYKGRPCGSFGDISIFSFYPNKHLTTGEGGMCVTDDENLAERCRSFKNLCFQADKRFVHEELGWNYRMTNMQAALGVAQLEMMEGHVTRKREMGALYTEILKDAPNLELPPAESIYAKSVYWVYGVVIGEKCGLDRDEVVGQLRDRKIGTRPFFWPMHLQPVFNKMGFFSGESHPVAERLARRGFYLPSGTALTETQIREVATALKEILT